MLTTDELTEIVRSVALEQGQSLEFHSVAATDGGSSRAEILLTVAGCPVDPCRLLINVTRETREQFEAEFRVKLAEALTRHHVAHAKPE